MKNSLGVRGVREAAGRLVHVAMAPEDRANRPPGVSAGHARTAFRLSRDGYRRRLGDVFLAVLNGFELGCDCVIPRFPCDGDDGFVASSRLL
jgi:hypothetical protein